MSIIGGINLGNLTNYLFFFADGSERADWHDAKHGYIGNVAVNGLLANEQTNAHIPYAGTVFTNDTTLGDWQDIVNANPGQAFASLNNVVLIDGLKNDLVNAFLQINALPVTSGYESRSTASLNGLNTQNGVSELFVINVTSGFDVTAPIYITGDPGDVYILRWDEDANPVNGYQGNVRFRQGGAIVPQGGLIATNFINVAGQLDSAGGGNPPPVPYPQGPRYNDGTGALIIGGSDWTDGGYFTGYWLTTGEPTIHDPMSGLWFGVTSSLSDATFVGGWYTITTQFVLTAQSGGVHIAPNSETLPQPGISVKKFVSPDNGVTWVDAPAAPGPIISSNVAPQFKFTVTNTGNVPLSLVSMTDSVYGVISVGGNLPVGGSFSAYIIKPWQLGEHENEVTATGNYQGEVVTASYLSHYLGVQVEVPAVQIVKYVSPDNGATWVDANTPPGPTILSSVQPQFKFVVTNIGNVDLTNVAVIDDKFGFIGSWDILQTGESEFFLYTATWEEGPHVNTATVTDDQGATDQNSAYYNGVLAVPSIQVIKYVSPDNGVTWIDAPAAPGPLISSNVLPQFKFTVTNIGNVPLSFVSLTDSVYGLISVGGNLPVGGSFNAYTVQPWQLGEHENQATATGEYNGETVSSSYLSHYVGVPVEVPAVKIVKYVSPDNGATWVDANTPPGPTIYSNIQPQFKFVVTNIGNVDLTNVQVTDDKFGFIGSLGILQAGESAIFFYTAAWAEGQHVNTATVTDDQGVTDTHSAYYNGVAALPGISIVKYVSVDNGVTWIHANTPPGPLLPEGMTAVFKYVVTNTGDVTLNNITLTDSVLGYLGSVPSLNPGDVYTVIP